VFLSQVSIIAMVWSSIAFGQMRSSEVSHPVMPVPSIDAEAIAARKSKVDPVLDRGIDFILDLVPDRNGLANCGCPNCNQGSRDSQIVWNGIGDPDGVHCRYCGHQYPSEQYPMDKVLSFTNRRGEPVQWEYYEDDDGKRYFFSARARYGRKWYVAELVQDMATLYSSTGDERYADAAAELLYRISQCHCRWVPVTRDAPQADATAPYTSDCSIWHHWHYRDMEPSVAYAYDYLYESGALERLGGRIGVDVKQAIEDDLLQASVGFARAFKESWDNASPILYAGLVLYGRVLNEPDYVHDGLNRAVELLRNKYLFDGMWQETTVSYHQMTTTMMRVAFDLAKGYCDPPGYVNPEDGKRFEDFDAMRDIPLFRKAVTVVDVLTFPNGRVVPINDTWAETELEPPQKSVPVLLPATGHVGLARGDDDSAMQTHLHFGASYGHRHLHSLSMILWARGRELLSDIGYSHAAWRLWTIRTASHNTVVVDGWDQHYMPGGNLILYAPLSERLQVVEAEDVSAYRDAVTDYRRRLLVVSTSETDAYVVDIFRVVGGRQHDWMLHGSADYDQTVRLTVPLEPLSGTMLGPDARFQLPTTEQDTGEFFGPEIDSQPPGGRRWYRLRGVAYAFMQAIGKGETGDDWSADFDFEDDSAVGLHTTVLGQPDTTVYPISSPSIRRAKDGYAGAVGVGRGYGADQCVCGYSGALVVHLAPPRYQIHHHAEARCTTSSQIKCTAKPPTSKRE
jgi:hypothetical protein